MKRVLITLVALGCFGLGWGLCPIPAASGCTTFAIKVGYDFMIAKNFDWPQGQGAFLVNPRGMIKEQIVIAPDQRPLRWIARLGNAVFTFLGVDLPVSGMNEGGLVVEVLRVFGEAPLSSRPARRFKGQPHRLLSLQWVQYVLDTAINLKDVEQALERVALEQFGAPVHLFICDATKRCAILEASRSENRLIRLADARVPALANKPYLQQARNPNRISGKSSRVGVIASLLEGHKSAIDPGELWDILDRVRLSITQWQILWSPTRMVVQWRLNRFARRTKHLLRIADLDFSCRRGRRGMRLETSLWDSPDELHPWTASENQRIWDDGILTVFGDQSRGQGQLLTRAVKASWKAVTCAPGF